MAVVNGGSLFAKSLKQEGVEQIFTICGGQIMPLIYGCRAEGIRVIDVRHENAGVYAADAYARMIKAKSPVMVLGDTSIYTKQYGEAVNGLAHYLDIPVFATTMARGMFGDEDDPLFTIGEGALSEADVILTFSLNINFRINLGKPPMVNANAKWIQVHPNITKIGFNAPAHIGIVAGTGAGSQQILDAQSCLI